MIEADAFAWAVEEACLNAWPSPREVLLGGWMLRAAGGPSRRLNSLSPLRGATLEVDAVLAQARQITDRLGQPLRVRVPALVHGLDQALEKRGWTGSSDTHTLAAPLDQLPDLSDELVSLSDVPSEAWFALRRVLLDGTDEADRATRSVVASLLVPRSFATVMVDGDVAAVGMGSLSGDLVVMEAIGTAPAYRGRGLAQRLVAGLMAWGRQQGARYAALQVVGDNVVARRLYARLGYAMELHGYRYYEQATPLTSSR